MEIENEQKLIGWIPRPRFSQFALTPVPRLSAPLPIQVPLYIPLPFWYSRSPSLALPWVVLPYKDLTITFKFPKDYLWKTFAIKLKAKLELEKYMIDDLVFSILPYLSTPLENTR